MILEALIGTVVLPALLSGAGVALAVRAGRKHEAGGGWALALGTGLAFCAAQLVLRGMPAFPGNESLDRVFWLALAAAAVGAVESLWRGLGRARWLLRLVLVGATLWLVLRPLIAHHWSGLEAAAWIASLELAVIGLWAALEGAVRPERPWAFPLGILPLAGGTSVALLLSGSAMLGQLAGAIAVSLVVWFGLSFGRMPQRGSVATLAILLPAFWLVGFFYSELSLTSLLLLVLATLFMLVERPLAERWTRPMAPSLVTGALVAACVAGALVPPLLASLSPEAGSYY